MTTRRCDYATKEMHLIVDGYNLLHVAHSLIHLNSIQLQRERDRLVDQLSAYQRLKGFEITVVFDGWQGGWSTEKRENKKGIVLVFSKLGEKADEVIKRLLKEKGSGAIVVTSDRDIARFAERLRISVISSEEFQEKIERSSFEPDETLEREADEEIAGKRKGLSRRLSKKEKRARTALKKL